MRNQRGYEPMTEAQANELRGMKVSDVSSVYSGKAGKCACGCAGSHRYNSTHVESATKNRGYAVSADEVNDRQVKKVLGLLQQALAERAQDVDAGDNHYAVEVNGRSYVVYPVKTNSGR